MIGKKTMSNRELTYSDFLAIARERQDLIDRLDRKEIKYMEYTAGLDRLLENYGLSKSEFNSAVFFFTEKKGDTFVFEQTTVPTKKSLKKVNTFAQPI